MEAVYGLLGVDRGVPEVWGSVYDIRELLRENRQNKKGYDKKTVHKVNNDCTARVEQIRVDSKRVFQDIVYQRKQEKQKQCRAAFIFQPDDIR